MNKNIFKTESVAEFLARGGQIKVCKPKSQKKQPRKTMRDEVAELKDIDFSALPEALRIRHGLR